MHLCDNPSCVRPSHLKEGTHKENIQDAATKQRLGRGAARGTKHWKAMFTEADIRTIRKRCAAGEKRSAVAASFGVSAGHIGLIVRRKLYASVKDPHG